MQDYSCRCGLEIPDVCQGRTKLMLQVNRGAGPTWVCQACYRWLIAEARASERRGADIAQRRAEVAHRRAPKSHALERALSTPKLL
jgi:hypothetical protein